MNHSKALTYDRLIGTWRSDRPRTFRHFRPKAGYSPQALRKLKALFGELVVTWDREVFRTELNGRCETARYEVVARDAESVVVRFADELTGLDRLHHIHFDGDHYWVATPGGSFCEYFRRVAGETRVAPERTEHVTS